MYQINQDRKKLINCYKKQLNKFYRNNDFSIQASLKSFILSLKFARDLYLIDLSVDITKNIIFSTLQTALTEYTLYENCILKYYKIIKQPNKPLTVEPLNLNKSKEDVLAEYQKERISH